MVIRAAKSLNARIVQPWITNHYDLTKYGKKLKKYKGIYKGRRCFVIGNGPSLRAEDLTVLHNRHEITFGFNRIYYMFNDTPWRPDFYLCQDEQVLRYCVNEVKNLELSVKFIPIQLKWNYSLAVDDAIYFNMLRQPDLSLKNFYLFSDDITKRIYGSNSCLYSGVQLAVYMGFTEIYFIGVDHNFRITQNNSGEIIVDEKAQDHFSAFPVKEEEQFEPLNIDQSTFTFISLRHYCETKNIGVFNATRGGKLEVFPRVSFDSIFEGKDIHNE